MKRYVLTGAPGCGKTTIIRALAAMGQTVVEEAATEVIAAAHAAGVEEPWTRPTFIDDITAMQTARQVAVTGSGVAFFDRSPLCTHALSVFLGYPIPPALAAELERIAAEQVYERRVMFVDNLGFVTATAARRISFADSLAFERVHEETYRAFGYDCVRIAPGPVAERARVVLALSL